jgi:hypothetical protein
LLHDHDFFIAETSKPQQKIFKDHLHYFDENREKEASDDDFEQLEEED